MVDKLNNIPEEILRLDHYTDDVSILIGENGSGKSTLLNNLSKYFLERDKDVVAIATSIHDKFDNNHRNFKTLRGRSGRRQARSTIKNALQNIAESEIQRLKNASQALKYVGFDPVIGFKLEELHKSFNEIIRTSNFPENDKEQINYLLEKTLREADAADSIIWLEIDSFSFSELEKSTLTELILWESRLKELKIIDRIEVFFA